MRSSALSRGGLDFLEIGEVADAAIVEVLFEQLAVADDVIDRRAQVVTQRREGRLLRRHCTQARLAGGFADAR